MRVAGFMRVAMLAILPAIGLSAAEPALAQTADPDTLAQKCRSGDRSACFAARDGYQKLLREEAVDAAVYLRWQDALRAACQQALTVGEACTSYGYPLSTGAYGIAKDYGKARWAYSRGCDARDPWSCHNYGFMTLEENRSSESPQVAVSQFMRACRYGKEESCDKVNDMVWLRNEDYPGVEKSMALNIEAEYWECVYHDNCGWVTGAYTKQPESAETYGKALRVYLKGCRNGDAVDCYNAGSRFTGSGKFADFSNGLALVMYRKSCELGDEDGCARVEDRTARELTGDGNFIDPLLPEHELYLVSMTAYEEGEFPQQLAGIEMMRWLAEMGIPMAQMQVAAWFYKGIPDPRSPDTDSIVEQKRWKTAELLVEAAENGVAEAALYLAGLQYNDRSFGSSEYKKGWSFAIAWAQALGSEEAVQWDIRRRKVENLRAEIRQQGMVAARQEQLRAEAQAQQAMIDRAWQRLYDKSDERVCANVIQGGRMTRECVSRDYARRNWPGNY